jgi:hypothetical protein
VAQLLALRRRLGRLARELGRREQILRHQRLRGADVDRGGVEQADVAAARHRRRLEADVGVKLWQRLADRVTRRDAEQLAAVGAGIEVPEHQRARGIVERTGHQVLHVVGVEALHPAGAL